MTQNEINKNKIKQKMASLERQSDDLQRALESELLSTGRRLLDIGKIGLGIVGGVLFSTLLLRKLINHQEPDTTEFPRKAPRRSKKVYQRFRDEIVQEISGEALLFLLTLVREKLKNYKNKSEKIQSE